MTRSSAFPAAALAALLAGASAAHAQPVQPVECASLPGQSACMKYEGPPNAPFRKDGNWFVCEWYVGESRCGELNYSFARNILRPGDSGREIAAIQAALKEVGYVIEADGKFGKMTTLAVKDLQARSGLTIDGKVGPKTLEFLMNGTSR